MKKITQKTKKAHSLKSEGKKQNKTKAYRTSRGRALHGGKNFELYSEHLGLKPCLCCLHTV